MTKDNDKLKRWLARSSPVRFAVQITLSVFLAEALVMFVLPLFRLRDEWEANLLDPVLLVFLLSPALYFFAFRPLVRDRAQRRIAAKVFENTREAVMITDAETNILMVNDAFCDITGYTREEVIGKTPRILSSGRQSKEFYQRMWHGLINNGRWHGELWNRRKNGEHYLESLSINAVYGRNGEVENYIAHFADIMERRNAEDRIRFLAHYDELTRLPNRNNLRRCVEEMIEVAEHNGYEIAILFIDLDRFKNINDSLGHPVGDRLLQLAAERFKKCLREEDTVARLGGDEFVIVLPMLRGRKTASIVATKVQTALSGPFSIDGYNLAVTPSIGISVYPDDGRDFDTLVKNADTAMYRAKQEGRNAFRFYISHMNEHVTERLMLENELRKAIENKELTLHYQPIVRSTTGELISVETLMRWRHAEMGWISPVKFIPVAEETGLINLIGDWALETACRQNREWQRSGLPDFPIAVNISAAQFHQRDFCAKVQEVAERNGLEPRYLALELTESMVMRDISGTIISLDKLAEAGFPLMIDDFGTGYSSLAYLKRFPIQKLKIDRSFVNELTANADDEAIVCAILSMADALNFEVIAEGVETEAQLARLLEHGCDQIQGYYVSKPLPADELETFVRRIQENPSLHRYDGNQRASA